MSPLEIALSVALLLSLLANGLQWLWRAAGEPIDPPHPVLSDRLKGRA